MKAGQELSQIYRALQDDKKAKEDELIALRNKTIQLEKEHKAVNRKPQITKQKQEEQDCNSVETSDGIGP